MHQYEVLQTLGVGKHGQVKKAIHRLSGCPVSVIIDLAHTNPLNVLLGC